MSHPVFLYLEKSALDQLKSNGRSYKDGRELAQFKNNLKELEIVKYGFLKELGYE